MPNLVRAGLKRAREASLAAALAAVASAGAGAQELTVFSVGSGDGDGTSIVLLGGSVRPEGLGLKPVVGLQAYWLQYDVLDGSETVLALTPSVGLQYRTEGAAVEGRVGYSLQDSDVDAPFIEGEGGGSGFTTTLSANSWATRPELQGQAAYNWESEFVWTQAQAVMPVASLDPGNVGVGAEVIYQTDTSAGGDYHALQYGPVLRYNNGRNFMVTLGAGRKDNNVGDDTWYARVTAVSFGLRL